MRRAAAARAWQADLRRWQDTHPQPAVHVCDPPDELDRSDSALVLQARRAQLSLHLQRRLQQHLLQEPSERPLLRPPRVWSRGPRLSALPEHPLRRHHWPRESLQPLLRLSHWPVAVGTDVDVTQHSALANRHSRRARAAARPYLAPPPSAVSSLGVAGRVRPEFLQQLPTYSCGVAPRAVSPLHPHLPFAPAPLLAMTLPLVTPELVAQAVLGTRALTLADVAPPTPADTSPAPSAFRPDLSALAAVLSAWQEVDEDVQLMEHPGTQRVPDSLRHPALAMPAGWPPRMPCVGVLHSPFALDVYGAALKVKLYTQQ